MTKEQFSRAHELVELNHLLRKEILIWNKDDPEHGIAYIIGHTWDPHQMRSLSKISDKVLIDFKKASIQDLERQIAEIKEEFEAI